MVSLFDTLATAAIPLLLLLVGGLLFATPNGFDSFKRGAENGLRTAVGLLPTLLLLLVGVNMLKASGAVELLGGLISPLTERLGLPSELLPLVLTRSFSGSASTAAYSSLLTELGADSFPALCASVIMGCSDTVVYIVSVYFSSLSLKRSGYAYPISIAVMLFGIFFSCFLCRLFLG